MLLREFKQHYKSGDLESVIAVTTPNNDGYYLIVKSHKWGVNSFLETGRSPKPRIFKTQSALLNAANSIGFRCKSVDISHL